MRNGAQAAWLAGAQGPRTEPVSKAGCSPLIRPNKRYAIASANSPSSSSSNGENVESGLVESVIGLRLP
jgi:hypothetical protein